jgi:isoquinoline 1-oxidoreductase alpha subunit
MQHHRCKRRRQADHDDRGSVAGYKHPLQVAWVQHTVPQCGFCQSGQIMAAAALLKSNPNPSDSEINTAMAGNICRCATYLAIREGIHAAAKATG